MSARHGRNRRYVFSHLREVGLPGVLAGQANRWSPHLAKSCRAHAERSARYLLGAWKVIGLRLGRRRHGDGSGNLHATTHKSLSLFIKKMDVAALHPTTKQYSIGVLYKIHKLLFRTLDYLITGLCLVTHPLLLVKSVCQILTPNYADVIELKTLDVVYAPNLI